MPFELDKKAFLENNSFRQLLTLKHINKVSKPLPSEDLVLPFRSHLSPPKNHIRMQIICCMSTLIDLVPVL
jgi:hypothetical protein